ncbi:hypothetical protein, partial [Pseudomonas aeruginosa]
SSPPADPAVYHSPHMPLLSDALPSPFIRRHFGLLVISFALANFSPKLIKNNLYLSLQEFSCVFFEEISVCGCYWFFL